MLTAEEFHRLLHHHHHHHHQPQLQFLGQPSFTPVPMPTQMMSTIMGLQHTVLPIPVHMFPVWGSDLKTSFKQISDLISQGGCWYASIDTEFPGTIHPLDKDRLRDPHYNYQMMKLNVNDTNIIQLGLTLADLRGNIYTWKFNFSDFDDRDPRQNKKEESVDFLKAHGIDFERHRIEGIRSADFADLFKQSLLNLANPPRTKTPHMTWVGFQSSYDFGFLTKILINGNILPDSFNEFKKTMRYYLGPSVYDVKHMMSLFPVLSRGMFPILDGSLDRVAETLGIAREAAKTHHQAGSDCLLTYQTFLKLRNFIYGLHGVDSGRGDIEKYCAGFLHGLGKVV